MKLASASTFSTELAVRVAFRSAQGQFWTGTGFAGDSSDWLGRDVVQGQQQPDDPTLEQVPTDSVVWTANRQHHPCGNAKSRLQARTRDRTMRLFIIHHATRFPTAGQGLAVEENGEATAYPAQGDAVERLFDTATCRRSAGSTSHGAVPPPSPGG